MKNKFRFYAGQYSTHMAKSWGIRYQIETLGGMGTHYGFAHKTWYIIVDVGMQSWCVGIAQMGQPAGEGK